MLLVAYSNLILSILFSLLYLKKYIYILIYVPSLSVSPIYCLLDHWKLQKNLYKLLITVKAFFGPFLFSLSVSSTVQRNRDRKFLYYFPCNSAFIRAAAMKLKKTETQIYQEASSNRTIFISLKVFK